MPQYCEACSRMVNGPLFYLPEDAAERMEWCIRLGLDVNQADDSKWRVCELHFNEEYVQSTDEKCSTLAEGILPKSLLTTEQLEQARLMWGQQLSNGQLQFAEKNLEIRNVVADAVSKAARSSDHNGADSAEEEPEDDDDLHSSIQSPQTKKLSGTESDYEPSSSSTQLEFDANETQPTKSEFNAADGDTNDMMNVPSACICFCSQLERLLNHCLHVDCSQPIVNGVKWTQKGSCLLASFTCQGDHLNTWSTQPPTTDMERTEHEMRRDSLDRTMTIIAAGLKNEERMLWEKSLMVPLFTVYALQSLQSCKDESYSEEIQLKIKECFCHQCNITSNTKETCDLALWSCWQNAKYEKELIKYARYGIIWMRMTAEAQDRFFQQAAAWKRIKKQTPIAKVAPALTKELDILYRVFEGRMPREKTLMIPLETIYALQSLPSCKGELYSEEIQQKIEECFNHKCNITYSWSRWRDKRHEKEITKYASRQGSRYCLTTEAQDHFSRQAAAWKRIKRKTPIKKLAPALALQLKLLYEKGGERAIPKDLSLVERGFQRKQIIPLEIVYALQRRKPFANYLEERNETTIPVSYSDEIEECFNHQCNITYILRWNYSRIKQIEKEIILYATRQREWTELTVEAKTRISKQAAAWERIKNYTLIEKLAPVLVEEIKVFFERASFEIGYKRIV